MTDVGTPGMHTDDAILDALRHAEKVEEEDRPIVLCFLAGRNVLIAAGEANAAIRRSELLLAAGGDPRRPLELHGRAVTALAGDLDEAARRTQLAAGLSELGDLAGAFPATTQALATLRLDSDLAWQCFAMALLAEALADAG